MFHMVIVGACLAVGFWIGKKIINNFEYHAYVQGDKLKKKTWPVIKHHAPIVGRKVLRGTQVAGYLTAYGIVKSAGWGCKKLATLRRGA